MNTDKTPALVGLTGPAGVGKTAVAREMQYRYGFVVVGFAGRLKQIVRELYDLSHEQVHGKLKEEVDGRYGISPRQIMQRFGTEVGRTIFEDTWTQALQQDLDMMRANGLTRFVIDDLRFENEAQWVRANGGHVYELARAGIHYGQNHPSEIGVQADDVVYNGEVKDTAHNVVNLEAMRCNK